MAATYLKTETAEKAVSLVLRENTGPVNRRVLTLFVTPDLRARFLGEWRKACTGDDRLIVGKRSEIHANPFALLKTYSRLDTTHVVIERLPDDAESDLAAACDAIPGVTVIVVSDETKLGPLFGSLPKAA